MKSIVEIQQPDGVLPCRLLELRERGLLHGEGCFVALFLSAYRLRLNAALNVSSRHGSGSLNAASSRWAICP
ncbi:hypothetical protein, partial [Burkholderia ubonensis]|uniref:hypothetical protein n=1 Tax=Burkholderia ubonensis TaxID=101571 RepID=UPI0012F7B500